MDGRGRTEEGRKVGKGQGVSDKRGKKGGAGSRREAERGGESESKKERKRTTGPGLGKTGQGQLGKIGLGGWMDKGEMIERKRKIKRAMERAAMVKRTEGERGKGMRGVGDDEEDD